MCTRAFICMSGFELNDFNWCHFYVRLRKIFDLIYFPFNSAQQQNLKKKQILVFNVLHGWALLDFRESDLLGWCSNSVSYLLFSISCCLLVFTVAAVDAVDASIPMRVDVIQTFSISTFSNSISMKRTPVLCCISISHSSTCVYVCVWVSEWVRTICNG